MKIKETVSGLSALLIVVLFSVGWIKNIVHIVGTEFVLSGETVIRCIGVFVAPIGAVIGWL